jgi:hypothetical protein
MLLPGSGLVTAAVLGLGLLSSLVQTAVTQQAEKDRCVVRKETSGLIRGDRVPAGCVLQHEEAQPAREDSDRPFIVCEETIFHTPLPKKSVLTNCVLLSRGRMLIPTVPPSDGKLGPVEREFGSVERHFGPVERHFGPVQRDFGRVDRDTRRQ